VKQLLHWLDNPQAYYWRTQAGAELDLFLFHRSRRIGIEIKRADALGISPSMRSALEDLRLDRLFVVYPGPTRYSLADKIEVMPLKECIETLMKLK
jgi:predicted AAA+ superfamily ATPase